ncbi:pirin family protein [Mycobacterium sp.]|uniref:pirin family protein n=1 Tax=Mycobacterium sp. TaxID=1785 RepID=UPI003A849E02
MSNLETVPTEVDCTASQPASAASPVEVLQPRDVPLDGSRAIEVRRTLPQRQRSTIGAWCFVDHFGPTSDRMDVPPHPHTGLQTVTWLFHGQLEHRDSAGVHVLVRPGELNLMTAGAGICHSEVSTDGRTLHGVQLWVALPDSDRDTGRDFVHYRPRPTRLSGGQARVFLGELAGSRAPVSTFTPLLGAQLDLDAGASLDLDIDATFEHGVLCDDGAARLDGIDLAEGELGYQGPGHSVLRLHNPGERAARVLLLGGTPFGERLVMWWNFVGHSHDELVEFRRLWQDADDRFGSVAGYRGSLARLPAPPMPTTRLKSRRAAQPKERR